MRIGLVTHQWPGVRLGGIGTYTQHCARGLVEAGHEVHVFTLTLPADVRGGIAAGVVVHEVDSVAGFAAAGAGGVMQAAGESGYRLGIGAMLCERVRAVHAGLPFDVVEGAEYEGMMSPLVMRRLAGKARVVVHIHSGSAIAGEAAGAGVIATEEGLRGEAFEFASLLGADGVCAPSMQVLRDTQRHCPGVEGEILPLPFYSKGSAGEFADRREARDVLFIGRLEMVKGAQLLPAAANIFLRENVQARLRIVGPDTAGSPDAGMGSMAAWMRRELDAGVAERVSFLGEQNAEEMQREMRGAAFLVVPSLFDSYSYVCCEAMAAGLPVVVSDGIGATEVVGDAGIVFARGDAGALAGAMGRLMRDAGLRERLSARAIVRASTTLSIRETMGRRVAFYERLVREPRVGGGLSERLARLPGRYVHSLMAGILGVVEVGAGISRVTAESPAMRLLRILERVREESGEPVRVMLYGAGRHTARLLAEASLWKARGHEVVGLIDDHVRYQAGDGMAWGLPVRSRAFVEAEARAGVRVVVVLSTDAFQERFWEQTEGLRGCGVRVFRLYE